jgi:hypothetical protein
LIRKYSNRKLYDTFQRKFITLDELLTLLIDQEDIRIEDSDTRIDITDLEVSKAIMRYINEGNDIPATLLNLLNMINESKGKKKTSNRTASFALNVRAANNTDIERLAESNGDVLSYVPAEIRLLNKSVEYLNGAIRILNSETPFNSTLHHELYVVYKEFDRKLSNLKKKYRLS